uniref:Uncharacterized protein n=1 Tax=Lepisosteus oculatus TaxID=7918 RepID=W5MEP3_LEPOC
MSAVLTVPFFKPSFLFRVFGSHNLTTVALKGVGSSFKKHTEAESKGIKAHFNMDESGVLTLDRVESVFETIVEEREEESTLTKLGNTISSLFGGGSSEPKANVSEPVQDEDESTAEAGKEEEEPEQKGENTPQEEKQETGEKVEGEPQAENKEKAEGETSAEKTDSQAKTEGENVGKEEDKKPEEDGGKTEDKEEEKKVKSQKKSKISEDIGVELQINDILNPSQDQIASSKKK